MKAKIIADSISDVGKRITTLQITLPKVLLAEFNTHRTFSRNFSSSRAIPTSKVVELEHFWPLFWGKNQKGMQSLDTEIEDIEAAKQIWQDAIDYCSKSSQKLMDLGLHKQWANRLNDWHVMATGIVTSTEWDNFFDLRDHPDAQPEIRLLAQLMKKVMAESSPQRLSAGEWHLPYIMSHEVNDSFFKKADDKQLLQKISAARCCRVSYLKQDGTMPNVNDDLALFDRLAASTPLHASPLEHQATPDQLQAGIRGQLTDWIQPKLHGNLNGWVQFRQLWERNLTK